MAVLIVLFTSLLVYRTAGALGVEWLASWHEAARWALATMLLFTAGAHFTRTREDLVRMMPSSIRWPRALVLFTGLCEIAGAIGLLVPLTRRAAGLSLILFFVAVFPANIRAARAGVTLRGKPVTTLWLRAPMQLLSIFLAWWVSR